jgi:hypothetical protein
LPDSKGKVRKTEGLGTKIRGSRKGVPNKVTAELKQMILGALDGVGGQEYLQRQADENPVAFMTLVGKVLPLTVTGTGKNGDITVRWGDGK